MNERGDAMSDLDRAVDQLFRAFTVEGPNPLLHRKALKHLHNNWPTLWNAITAVLAARDSGGA